MAEKTLVTTSSTTVKTLVMSVNMANIMNVPVLGLIENMSYVKCPDCGKEIRVFGESNIDGIAKDFGLKVLARIPIEQEMSVSIDHGEVEKLDASCLNEAAEAVESFIKKV